MDLKEILAVSGYPGLYQFVSQGRNGIIVESLVDKKRTNVPASAKVSSMYDIAVFTDTDEVPLREVFQKIKDKTNGETALDIKTSKDDELKKYFAEILPNYDKDRVYMSDIKKMISWYNILQKNGMLDFEEKEEEVAEEDKKSDASAEKAPKVAKPAATRKPAATKPTAKASSKAAGAAAKVQAPRKAQ